MERIKWMLMIFMLFQALLVCHSQKSWILKASLGQDVVFPCGVQVKGSFQRLVWKSVDVSSTEDLAHSFEGSISCDTRKKQNCSLGPDGSLELRNVQETDSGDYFCVLDLEEKYYSQHTLVVHPVVAFETYPNPEDVFVTQAGPDEIVLAYTNPVCRNADVIGIVTCDPPSGVKIGINVTEIVCTCSHSGNEVDTCTIPIPDASPSFENCSESDFVCGTNAVGIVCAPVTELGIFIGIIIGAVLVVTVYTPILLLLCIANLKKKHNWKQTINEKINLESWEHMQPESTTHLQVESIKECDSRLFSSATPDPEGDYYITSCDVLDEKHMQPESTTLLQVESTKERDSGLFSCATPDPEGDDGITSCNVLDENSNYQTDTQHSIPCCTEIREFVVEDVSENLRILPSRTIPTGGIAISCNHNENLTVGFQKGDLSTIPKPSIDPFTGGMTISVADTVAVPVHINCLKCGNSCCILEVNGSEWSKEQPEIDCKITCAEEDAEEI